MRILLDVICKKIHVDYYSKRFLSYRIRKGVCCLLSKPDFDEDGERLFNINCAKNSKMSKCSKLEINVITNGTSETSSFFMDVGAFSYLFNCGENAVRARSEIRHKVSRLQGIFVTSSCWRHLGGILGTVTSQRKVSKEFLIFGPPEIGDIVSRFQASFLEKSPLFLKVQAKSSKHIFDDGIIKIKFVPIFSEQTETETKSREVADDDSEIMSHSQGSNNKKNLGNCVLNYICQSEDFGHHLDMEACLKRKIPVGPLLKVLKQKQNVTLENGEVVNWQDVSKTSSGPETFVIADCPSVEYLEPFLNEKEFVSCQSSGETPANLIIHFTPPEVMKTEKYYKWMSLFPQSANHLVLNEDNLDCDFYSTHDFHKKLNFLSSNIFPPIIDKGLPVMKEKFSEELWRANYFLYTCQDEEKERRIEGDVKIQNTFSARKALISMPDIFQSFNGMKIVRAIPSLTFSYHPKPLYDWRFQACHNINTIIKKSIISSGEANKGLQSKLRDFQEYEKFWMGSEECRKRPEYPKIIFLGTGSGEPARRRSASAIMVFLNENEIVLLDCGEGTYMQMCRFFGRDQVDGIINKIIMVFVSHFHMDHHIGLNSILIRRLESSSNNKSKRKLVIFAPVLVKFYLNDISSYIPILENVMVVDNDELSRNNMNLKTFFSATTLGSIQTCLVPHCKNSFAISFKHKNGYKITYSGDTLPCPELATLGKDSDILIHEATFDDNLKEMARGKKHCTVSQAIKIGVEMKAKYIILTHFSQRYAAVPLIDYEALPKNIGIAFDFMMVNERVIPLLTKLMPLFKVLFDRELHMLQVKADTSKLLKREKSPVDMNEDGQNDKSTPVKIKKLNNL